MMTKSSWLWPEHLALALHDADDGEGRAADDEVRAEDRFVELEFVDDLLADHAHPRRALDVEVGEEPAPAHPVIGNLLVGWPDAEQHRGGACGCPIGSVRLRKNTGLKSAIPEARSMMARPSS